MSVATIPPENHQHQRHRIWRSIILLVLIGIAVHVLIPQIASVEDSLHTLRTLGVWWIVLAVIAQMLSYVGSGYLLRAIADVAGGTLSILRGILITLAASCVRLVGAGPVTFGAASYRWMRASHIDQSGALLAGWLPSALNTVVQLATAVCGVCYLLALHRLSKWAVVAFSLVLAVLLLLLAFVWWIGQHRERFTSSLTVLLSKYASLRHRAFDKLRTEHAAAEFYETLQRLEGGGWRGPTAGAVLNIGFDVLSLLFLFVAAGHAVSPGTLLAGYGLPLLLGKVGFLPGGIGIVEASMAAIYEMLDVPRAVSVVVILGYRVLSFWIPTVLGLPLIVYFQRKPLYSNHVS